MAYRCSKSALNQAGVTMARELKAKDIAVGLVHPGMLKTNFGGGIPDSKAKWFRPRRRRCARGHRGHRRAHHGNHRRIHPRKLRKRTQAVPLVMTVSTMTCSTRTAV